MELAATQIIETVKILREEVTFVGVKLMGINIFDRAESFSPKCFTPT